MTAVFDPMFSGMHVESGAAWRSIPRTMNRQPGHPRAALRHLRGRDLGRDLAFVIHP